ncbi:MAG: hypothetical protein M1834_000674 [Cirrosporium novae-zelandiae]|nr:MAG: hypothetical protein M1834_000674 [Cirrosporium novae-zelandiae]
MSPSSSSEIKLKWDALTEVLYTNPYSPSFYLARSHFYFSQGFPDLASGDAYRGLLLIDEIEDEEGEYHDEAVASVVEGEGVERLAKELYLLLGQSLKRCGCLESAYNFLTRAIGRWPEEDSLVEERRNLHETYLLEEKRKLKDDSSGKSAQSLSDFAHPTSTCNTTHTSGSCKLPDTGHAPRILYPWNTHEPSRYSTSTLSTLNSLLRPHGPNLEIRKVALPLLTYDGKGKEDVTQLGLFSTTDLPPTTAVLHERTLLTATATLHGELCDACAAPLPPLSSTASASQQPVACPSCPDTIFCSSSCLSEAQKIYHPALCSDGNADPFIHTLFKDPKPADAADALYSLLLLRVLAMAETQEVHPLDLMVVKYIWGDFASSPKAYPLPSPEANEAKVEAEYVKPYTTLPFTFTHCIQDPIHILYSMDINPFTSLSTLSDPWIHQTLFAKFRGTASGRVNPRTGIPETAAVHPLWCLANHSCAPNVEWKWGGEMILKVREKKVEWGDEKDKGKWEGIKKDQEILNHYCDVYLPAKERREWAAGALGGVCMCDRCVWEASQKEE